MVRTQTKRLQRVLAWWVDQVRVVAGWVVAAALLVTGAALYYTVNNLGINTDTDAMISEELPFRQAFIEYRSVFPQYAATIVVVIDGATPDLAHDAAAVLAARLEEETRLFETVYAPGRGRFFEENAFLYLSPAELEDLADNLAEVQPFLAKLGRDQSLRGLFSTLEHAVQAAEDGQDIDFGFAFGRVSDAVEAKLAGRYYRLSWQELMLGRTSSPGDRRRFIVVQPRLDYSKLLPGAPAMNALRRLAEELRLDPAHGVRVRLTGVVALSYEELLSVSRGSETAAVVSLVIVGILLFLGLRQARLVFATVVTLLLGLIWTAGFATLAIGHLNLISVAFAVLYIGLGVDYAIHFCLRYREVRRQGADHSAALRRAAEDVGSSLVICAVTTAIGFYAFVPTDYAGVAELGWISGTGMFISLVANLTVLPALLSLLPPAHIAPAKRPPGRWSAAIVSFPATRPGVIRAGALLLGLGGVFLVPRITFDHNPLNLRDPAAESVATYNDLLAQSTTSPWSGLLIAGDAGAASESATRLAGLSVVDKVLFVKDFIPSRQDEKLALVEEIALLLGPDLEEDDRLRPPGAEEQVQAIRNFLARLDSADPNLDVLQTGDAVRLKQSLRALAGELEAMTPAARQIWLSELEASLLASLPERLRTLESALEADYVALDDLPRDLVERWVAEDGRYRVEVFPQENVGDNEALARFIDQVRTVAPGVTGASVQILESGRAVGRAFRQAIVSAVIAVTVLLWILLRRKTDVLLVLVPLILAGILTGAASVLLAIPFNFANVIALPLLLGVGVDNGIHMVHRARTAAPEGGNLLRTSTARGVLFSALTTLGSFGNLALSSHRGMASMGQLLFIGIGLTLVCTLFVLPALLGAASSVSQGLSRQR